ncbi:MAG: hypothetical protein PHD43_24315, partial [Methylococcales bacterium]|nr:hypothetical protein [Methylococcales bacterium]
MPINILGWNLSSPAEQVKSIEDGNRVTRGWGNSDFLSMELKFDNVAMGALYDYAYFSDTYRTIINVLERETFRNGGKWKPRFVRKCLKCGTEFETEMDECEFCGGTTRAPNPMQKKSFEPFLKSANANGQSFLDVLSSMDPDYHILDNGYIMFLKKYYYNDDGEIVSAKPVELLRGDPLYLRMIIDRKGRPGYDYYSEQRMLVCPEHRTRTQVGYKCGELGCGKRLYPAYFKTEGEKTIFYLAGEVFHTTRYTKTIFYGFPMALTVIGKIKTLLSMDNFVWQYYSGQKSPKGILLVRTSNINSMNKVWDDFLTKAAANPHSVYPLFVPSTAAPDTNKLFEYLDFMRSLEEMQYMEARTEMINRCGAPFGVSPIFQNDVSASGGLNNEGMQVTVSSRALEANQSVHNKVSRWVLDQIGVTDWDWILAPVEERDEMAELQKEALKIANASAMQSMGFDVSHKPDGTFKFSGKPISNPTQE